MFDTFCFYYYSANLFARVIMKINMLHSNFLRLLLEVPPRQAEGEDERSDAEAEHSDVSPNFLSVSFDFFPYPHCRYNFDSSSVIKTPK